MVNINNIYEEIKVPIDETLINKFIEAYLNIPYKMMNSMTKEVNNLLYNKINIIEEKSNNVVNQNDFNKFIAKINNDFIASGRPFDPNTHNGITNPIAVQPGWNTIKSWNLIGGEKISEREFNHRFYIAPKNEDLYIFVNSLYDKFKSYNIPFYFKVESFNDVTRRDKIVVYTSTKYLKDTIDVLNEVSFEKRDILNRAYDTSFITGKFNDKIGYAEEDFDIYTSYTGFMCNVFTHILSRVVNSYNLDTNLDIKKLYEDKINLYNENGYNTSNNNVKNRVLFNILLENKPDNIKKKLLSAFIYEVHNNDYDPTNLCFSRRAKKEIDDFNSGISININKTY